MENIFESIITKNLNEQEDKEDKPKFLNDLCKLLQSTRHYSDLESIEYINDNGEYAILHFKNGSEKKADITADSEVSMIRDILNQTE